MSYLESIIPSRSTMLEDSTNLACETPLKNCLAKETSKIRLVVSNGIEACRVLPISAKHGKR